MSFPKTTNLFKVNDFTHHSSSTTSQAEIPPKKLEIPSFLSINPSFQAEEKISDSLKKDIFEITKKLKSPIIHISKTPSLHQKKNTVTKLIKPKISFRSINGKLTKRHLNMFTTFLYHKRGRKSKSINGSKNRRVHSKSNLDNVIRKIHVNYITFLVSLANDTLKAFFGEKTKYNFKDITFKFKEKVSYERLKEIKKFSYSDILKTTMSSKYKSNEMESNKSTYDNVCEKSDKLKTFFDQGFLEIFKKYYYNEEKELKEFYIDDILVKTGNNTKSFYDLLMNNISLKENIRQVVKDVYFNGENISLANKFKVTKIDKDKNNIINCKEEDDI